MHERGLRSGHLLALAGALAAIGSLWGPWFAVVVTPKVRLQVHHHEADVLFSPSLARYAHVGRAPLPASFHADAWTLFHQTDLAVAALAALVMIVVLLAAGALGDKAEVDLAIAGSICAALGGACAVVIANQILHPPGTSGVVAVAWAAYAGLGAAMAIVAGGLWAAGRGSARSSSESVWATAAEQQEHEQAAKTEDQLRPQSVAPPGAAVTADAH